MQVIKKWPIWKGEPSESKVVIDLDWGSLVVKTKKLDKKSSFDINSPVGRRASGERNFKCHKIQVRVCSWM